jgi:hypothetical protein
MRTETKLDFDRTVNTEDRFAIRKALATLIDAINSREEAVYSSMLSEAVIVEGFSDFVQVKAGFITMLRQKFKPTNDRVVQMPSLKLSYSHYLYHLEGTYEEILDGILVTEGTIEFSLIKEDEEYKVVRIIFYPRMMLSDDIL